MSWPPPPPVGTGSTCPAPAPAPAPAPSPAASLRYLRRAASENGTVWSSCQVKIFLHVWCLAGASRRADCVNSMGAPYYIKRKTRRLLKRLLDVLLDGTTQVKATVAAVIDMHYRCQSNKTRGTPRLPDAGVWPVLHWLPAPGFPGTKRKFTMPEIRRRNPRATNRCLHYRLQDVEILILLKSNVSPKIKINNNLTFATV